MSARLRDLQTRVRSPHGQPRSPRSPTPPTSRAQLHAPTPPRSSRATRRRARRCCRCCTSCSRVDGYVTGRGIDLLRRAARPRAPPRSPASRRSTRSTSATPTARTPSASAPTRCARSWAATQIWDAVSEHLGVGHDETTAGRQDHPRARRVQRGLRLRPGRHGQLGVLRQPDPGVHHGARRRRCAPARRSRPPAAPTPGGAPSRRSRRVLAGFHDGLADEGVGAGPARCRPESRTSRAGRTERRLGPPAGRTAGRPRSPPTRRGQGRPGTRRATSPAPATPGRRAGRLRQRRRQRSPRGALAEGDVDRCHRERRRRRRDKTGAARRAHEHHDEEEGLVMATTLTPILTAFWDDPKSWTLETYERQRAATRRSSKALGMEPRPTSSRPSRTPACAAVAAPASPPA